MKKHSVILLSMTGLLIHPVSAATLDIISLNITGGDVAFFSPAVGSCGVSLNHVCLSPGTSNPLVMGAYQGNAIDPVSIINYTPDVYIYSFTAASALDAWDNPTGLPNGIVDTVAGTITVDFGGWYVNQDGINFWQGTNPYRNDVSDYATGNYDPLTGTFHLSWTSVTSSFYGDPVYWHLTGTAEVAPVPVPAAIWLFGSGLVGLVGMSRRNHK